MTPGTAGVHVRENFGVLARTEKRTLIWIARSLPDSINSDHLSALGLLSMAAVGLSFAAFQWTRWAAIGVVLSLVMNWFGDSLDGTVARVRNQQRPRYGFYVDHVIDLIGTTFLLAGIAISGLMHPLIAVLVLVAFFLVSAELYLATHTRGTFRMSFLGFGPTELRIVIAIGTIKAAVSPYIAFGPFEGTKLFDIGGLAAIAGMGIAFVAASIRNIVFLYRAEPLPKRAAETRTA